MNKLFVLGGKNKKGFSLMEVMISVLVLSIGITAVLSLMTGNISNSINSRDNIIASELAQEGVELVRNIRDNNFVSGAAAFAGFSNGDCRVSYNVSGCNSGSYLLNYNSGYYTHNGSGATKFRRKINIANYVNASTGRKIISTVWWDGNASAPASCNMATKCVSAEDILTDWN